MVTKGLHHTPAKRAVMWCSKRKQIMTKQGSSGGGEVSSGQGSGCFQCGSPQGSASRLCPTCVATNAERRNQFKKALEVDRTGERDTFLFKLFGMSLGIKLITFMVVIIGMTVAVMIADSRGLTAIPFILLFSALASGILAASSLITMIGIIYSNDRELGIKLLLFFPFLYPLLWSSSKAQNGLWDALKNLAIAHGVGVALFIGTVMTAESISVNLFAPSTYGLGGSATVIIVGTPGDQPTPQRAPPPANAPLQGDSPVNREFSGYDF